MRAWLMCFIACASCALARERDVDGGPLPDAGIFDAGRLGDAGAVEPAGPDVGAIGPAECPPRGPTFTFAASGTFEIDAPLQWLVLGGDGESVYALLGTYPPGLAVLHLDAVGSRAVEILRREEDFGSITVDDGVARLVVRDEPTSETLRLFDSSAGPLTELGTMPAPAASIGPGQVGWNGASLVAAIQTSDFYNVWLGRFEPGSGTAAWQERWPVEEPAITVDAATGRTHLVVRTAYTRDLRWLAVNATGALLWDRPLDSAGLLEWGYDIAWVDDETDEPLILTGHAERLGGAPIVQRFRADGRLGASFTFPTHALHATTTGVAPRGVTTGYGVAALLDETRRVAFHGRADGIVSGVLELPTTCREHIAIAAGACGYLVACGLGTTIDTFLAVPPASM